MLRLLARRHTQLGWSYNKTACRLHALVADLVPGGISKEVVVSQARSLLAEHPPIGRGGHRTARARRSSSSTSSSGSTPNARRCASGSASPSPRRARRSPTIFGVGDVGAAIILGQVGDVARFRTADRFAAYNGTAPIEWSSGNPARPIHRLSRRGNRTLNHVIHIAAVTQLRHRHSPGRAYYDRKRSRGPDRPRRAPLVEATDQRRDLPAPRRRRRPPRADGPGRAIQETTPQASVTGPTS